LNNKKQTIPIFSAIFLVLFCTISFIANAQQAAATNKGNVLIVQHKDSVIMPEPVALKSNFESDIALQTFILSLPKALALQGYATSSVDSIWVQNDTTYIQLFYGKKYNWVHFRTIGIEKNILEKAGYADNDFVNKPFNIDAVNSLKNKLLAVYQNNGYPFATIYLDSINIVDNTIAANLKANTILLYKIDSIRNVGNLKLKSIFLQRYLAIKNGSTYNITALQDVDRRLRELPFAEMIQTSYLEMLGSGAALRLNLNNKKSSEASAIFGLQQDVSNVGKYILTGDINFDLKNLFGAGEGFLLKYQSLQPKSPRLNIGFDKPYIFNSQYGLNFLADFYKRDTSFVQLNAQLGFQFEVAKFQTIKVFLQRQSTGLLPEGVDTARIRVRKILPNIIDVAANNFGFVYEFRNTNYKFNPVKGNDIVLQTTIGTKTIKKSNTILSIVQPGFNYESLYDNIALKSYQIRVKLNAAHYFKMSKTSTIKTAANFGLYNSPAIFRNDVFQIGGNKLLRGFDEESIFATNYVVTTAEYRSLLTLNSYLFGFVDAGLTKTKFFNTDASNNFISTGLGILYETKAGLLNISLAIGKRNDVPFGLGRAAKIHFGYVNYF
jgi:outer membrane protein assembly factor BamA